MTDYGTIKLPRDEYERHNERRKENGQTWAEYVDGEAPDGATDAALVEAIEDRLDALEHDAASGGETVSFDDITAACRKALRDELPEGALR